MIRDASFPPDSSLVKILFREYASALGVDLAFQHFDRELADLPGDYAPKTGALLLAVEGDGPALGCVALRRLEPGLCEMKRLYVRPAARGRGVGRALIEAIVDRARLLDYRAMRLDTLPVQSDAQRLYQAVGFVDIAPYRLNPIEGTRFLELDLSRSDLDSTR
jgi:GNAT superfamily N-acetyltransferase